MPLTDTAIRNAKPGKKPIKLFDGGGLYLEVSRAGGKWWRLKYRFDGKEKRLSLGVQPETKLAETPTGPETWRLGPMTGPKIPRSWTRVFAS